MKKGEKQGFWGEKRRRCACKLLCNRMKAFRKIQNSLPEGYDSKPCRKGTLYCPKGLEGKGLERETLLPFPRLRRFGTHYETGSKFLLLFSIKSKEEILCFAERVLNGRMTNVVQPPLSLYLDYSTKPAPHFLRLSYNSPSPFGCKIPLGLL